MPDDVLDDDFLDDDFLDDELLMRRRWLRAPAQEADAPPGADPPPIRGLRWIDHGDNGDDGDPGEAESDDELRAFIEDLDGDGADAGRRSAPGGPVPLFPGDRAGR